MLAAVIAEEVRLYGQRRIAEACRARRLRAACAKKVAERGSDLELVARRSSRPAPLGAAGYRRRDGPSSLNRF